MNNILNLTPEQKTTFKHAGLGILAVAIIIGLLAIWGMVSKYNARITALENDIVEFQEIDFTATSSKELFINNVDVSIAVIQDVARQQQQGQNQMMPQPTP